MFALTQITKQEVDSFDTGQEIPSCQLRAEWTEESKPSRLIHKMTLKGAKEPNNYVFIELEPGSTQPGIPRGGLMCMIIHNSAYTRNTYVQSVCLAHVSSMQ